jgi:S-adenosylmethionine hydrolase
MADIGEKTNDWTPGWIDEPDVTPHKVVGVIVTIDTFGNLISNIDASLIRDYKEPVAEIAGHQISAQPTYGRAQPGDYLTLINSFGVVEVARAEGSAADGLGSERGAPLVIRDGYQT